MRLYEVALWPNDERPIELGGGGVQMIRLTRQFPLVQEWGQQIDGLEYRGRGIYDLGVTTSKGDEILWHLSCVKDEAGNDIEQGNAPITDGLWHLEVDDPQIRHFLRPFQESWYVTERLVRCGWVMHKGDQAKYENYLEWERTNAAIGLDHAVTRNGTVMGKLNADGSVSLGEIEL